MNVTLSCPRASQRVQNEFCNYNSISDFLAMLHEVKTQLKPPESALTVIEWFKRNAESVKNSEQTSKHGKKYGCRFPNNQTIANEMDCSLRTVQNGIAWLKALGIFFVKRTKGTSYKYWAKAQDVMAVIGNYFKVLFSQDNSHQDSHHVAHHVAHPNLQNNAPIPCESKAPAFEEENHINTLFKSDIQKHYIKHDLLEEEEVPQIKPRSIKFKNDFSVQEIETAIKFVFPQMKSVKQELNLSDDFFNRFICYMQQAKLKYVSEKEFRAKNMELERANYRDKKGKQIEDLALYMVKGIAMKRKTADSDRSVYQLEQAEKVMNERKQREQQMPTIPFYNWLESDKPMERQTSRHNERLEPTGFFEEYSFKF